MTTPKPVYLVEYWKDTDDGWWLVWVYNLAGGTMAQARTRFDVPLEAQDLIMTMMECGSHDFVMSPMYHRDRPTWAAEDDDVDDDEM